MKVKKTNIPTDSLTHRYRPYSYSDAYACEFHSEKPVDTDDILIAFRTDMPTWVEALFCLRNILVRPFGLRGSNKEETGDKEQFVRAIRDGDSYHGAKVSDKSPTETVLQSDDKHLRAYISVYVGSSGEHRYSAFIITIVQFKYWLGYAYFYTIYPFHHLIVKTMFRHVINKRISS
ncbi:MAG: DUF2867 domain-containing protein [Bacteroides sp.]|nr:DUF2867 domain-containing protein [Bacteroides sp.]